MTKRLHRRLLGPVTVGALAATSLLPAGASPEAYGGYQLTSLTRAVGVVPVTPGFLPGNDTPVEGSLSRTASTLASGDLASGLAAVAWPGPVLAHMGPLLLASGAPAELANAIPAVPLTAEAGARDGTVTNTQVPGVVVEASGSPVRSSGTAALPPTSTALFTTSSSRATSSTVRTADKVTATSTATIQGIRIAGGAITIAGITAMSEAVSDGTSASTKGSVALTGVEIGGVPVTVDGTGVHAQGQTVPGTDPTAAVNAVLDSLGAHLQLAGPVNYRNGLSASRQDPGLVVTLNYPEAGTFPAGEVLLQFGATSVSATTSPPDSSVPTPLGSIAAGSGGAGGTGGGSVSSGGPPSAGSSAALVPTLLPPLAAGPTGPTGPTAAVQDPAPSGFRTAASSAETALGYRPGGVPLGLTLALFLAVGLCTASLRRYVTRITGGTA